MENVCLSICPEVCLSNLLFAVLPGAMPSDVTSSCSRCLETPNIVSQRCQHNRLSRSSAELISSEWCFYASPLSAVCWSSTSGATDALDRSENSAFARSFCDGFGRSCFRGSSLCKRVGFSTLTSVKSRCNHVIYEY